MNTIQTFDKFIGLCVRTGSPGYEQPEIISNVKPSNAFGDEGRLFIAFKSGCTTNMPENKLDVLMEQGEIEYVRWFMGASDRAYETMSLV